VPDGTQQERFGQKKQASDRSKPRRITGEGKQAIEAVMKAEGTG